MATPIEKSWLTERLTVPELEKQLGFKFDALKNIGASSNRWLEVWSRFAKSHQFSDELWLYSKPKAEEALQGEAGVALVRKGAVISHVVTVES